MVMTTVVMAQMKLIVPNGLVNQGGIGNIIVHLFHLKSAELKMDLIDLIVHFILFFRCWRNESVICIPGFSVCNGVFDCEDHSDERLCE